MSKPARFGCSNFSCHMWHDLTRHNLITALVFAIRRSVKSASHVSPPVCARVSTQLSQRTGYDDETRRSSSGAITTDFFLKFLFRYRHREQRIIYARLTSVRIRTYLILLLLLLLHRLRRFYCAA